MERTFALLGGGLIVKWPQPPRGGQRVLHDLYPCAETAFDEIVDGCVKHERRAAVAEPQRVLGRAHRQDVVVGASKGKRRIVGAHTRHHARKIFPQGWLWKDHTSYHEAARITKLAVEHRPQFIAKCGNTYSSEWF